jgi:hypothetical protein
MDSNEKKSKINYAWLAYGCVMVLLGLWYISDELKKLRKSETEIISDVESQEDTQEEEESNDTGRS